jgi:hypothetical protein
MAKCLHTVFQSDKQKKWVVHGIFSYRIKEISGSRRWRISPGLLSPVPPPNPGSVLKYSLSHRVFKKNKGSDKLSKAILTSLLFSSTVTF